MNTNKIKKTLLSGVMAAVRGAAKAAGLAQSVKNLQKVDEKGLLYSADYVGDYYKKSITALPFRLMRSGSCSAFIAQSPEGTPLTGRNYDLAHKNKDGNVTGLNIALYCAPEGKYRSINIADAMWLSFLGCPMEAGAPDRKNFPKQLLGFLPFLCMDGLNEKGLCVSILALDRKKGEHKPHQNERGKKCVSVNELVRYTLDSCADVPEAVAFAKTFNLRGILQMDYHLFLTDKTGRSAVLEWRNDALCVVENDAVTNFYTGFDDAEDCYLKGQLKEKFIQPPAHARPYRYGYGHGFGRFETIVSALDACRPAPDAPAIMEKDRVLSTLKAASQAFDHTLLSSCTQYSAVYDNARGEATVYMMRNYKKGYTFRLR